MAEAKASAPASGKGIQVDPQEIVEAILSTMDNEHAIFYLIESVKYAHKKGCYTIGETEVLSKAIRTLLK